MQHLFRSPEYPWPSDCLHWWSRCWEYPYVMHHLRKLASAAAKPRVLDLGSGVTFFPFAVAREGFDVTAVDVDPVVQKDMNKAIEAVPSTPGSVVFALTDGERLDLADASQDVAYCISVIEHIDNPDPLLREIDRVLTTAGTLILTVDVDVEGHSYIGPEKFYRMLEMIDAKFTKVYPDRPVHPQDILTTDRGPYPLQIPRSIGSKLLSTVGIGGNSKIVAGCYGAVYRKKD